LEGFEESNKITICIRASNYVLSSKLLPPRLFTLCLTPVTISIAIVSASIDLHTQLDLMNTNDSAGLPPGQPFDPLTAGCDQLMG
jgi:hypothetical protein